MEITNFIPSKWIIELSNCFALLFLNGNHLLEEDFLKILWKEQIFKEFYMTFLLFLLWELLSAFLDIYPNFREANFPEVGYPDYSTLSAPNSFSKNFFDVHWPISLEGCDSTRIQIYWKFIMIDYTVIC